jgi:hypothetical protein
MVTFLWLHENETRTAASGLGARLGAAARAGDRAELARTFRLLAGQEERVEPSDKKGTGDKTADGRQDGRPP